MLYRVPTLVLVAVTLSGTTAWAQQQADTPASVKAMVARLKANAGRDAGVLTLKGVKQVMVTVEPLNSAATTLGLDSARIRSLAEVKLRDNGLSLMAPYSLGRMDPATGKVLDFHPEGRTRTSVVVDVQVTVASLQIGTTAIAVNVWLKQPVTLLRDPSIPSMASTWVTGSLYVASTPQEAQAAADDLVTAQIEQLLTAWSGANR